MYTIKDLLRIEVAPALGCTEPAAVALCAAAARSLMKEEDSIDSILIRVDQNVYKNGMGVAIPGTEGNFGIDLAGALGAVCGDPDLKLEVLSPVDDEAMGRAKKLIKEKKVKIEVISDTKGIFIESKIFSGESIAEAIIEELHDNLTSLKLNGKRIKNHHLLSETEHTKTELSKLEAWLKTKSLRELIGLLDTIDKEDLEFIEKGLDYNLKLAEYGITYGSGLGVGKALERLSIEGLLNKDMMLSARILTAAAADARMSGVKMIAMSSGGSGNHGLTAILPIWGIKDYLEIKDKTRIFKAMALSHIITAYIKAFTGRLSAICGCSIAAGAGATAGIAFLMGGDISHISGAIKNLIEDLAGIICDGAKNSCALKLSTAAGTAVQSALFALHGIDVKDSDGIIASTPEQTMKNVGKLSTEGMIEADRTILQIMIEKHIG